MKTCARPGCSNPLRSGKKYCSPKCSANRNTPVVQLKTTPLTVPKEIQEAIRATAGNDAGEILRMIDTVSLTVAPESSQARTRGDWSLTMDGKTELRPSSTLDYDIVDTMAESGVIKFATYVKMAGILIPFASSRTWSINSQNKRLAEVVEAAMSPYVFQMMSDIVYSMTVYGTSVQETLFANKTPYDIGLVGNKLYTVPLMPKPVHPRTVELRRRNNRFDGFIQTVDPAKSIRVPAENALVIANERRFRRNWGQSSYKAAYPLWFWYEVVLRSMVRYMERMGTPVTVVSAPSRKKVRKPGTSDLVDAMTWGLKVASDAGMSSALVIPSDVDPETGNPFWNISYLSSQERSQPFISVLEQLTQMILRSMVIADRAVSKDSGTTGSYAMAEVHAKAQQVQNQMTVSSILTAINRYYMPHIARYNSLGRVPSLRMSTTGLDTNAVEMITKIFGMAGNSPATQGALGRIDFASMAKDAGIPFLDKPLDAPQPADSQPQSSTAPADNQPPSTQQQTMSDAYDAIVMSGKNIKAIPLSIEDINKIGVRIK